MSSDPPVLAILGGGQLGQMLALAGIPLGVSVRSLDPVAGAPAAAVSTLTVGALDDPDALRATVGGAEIVTFEWEGVPAGPLRALIADGAVLRPSVDALEVSQDRVDEKTTFRRLGIPVADFAPVADAAELAAAVAGIGTPAILKTRRGGYDGKGQAPVDGPDDAPAAFVALADGGPLILERRIPFDRELSIVAARGVDGAVRTWPLVENEHRGGILRTTHAPAVDVDPTLQAAADGHVRAVLEHFDYVGVLTLELFQVGHELLANEMAPRVHNSGHWTIEGALTSQFENHVRAVLGWPLGPTDAPTPSVMINCIGALPEPADVLAVAGAHLHRYGKSLRPGRKVGHVTVTAPDAASSPGASTRSGQCCLPTSAESPAARGGRPVLARILPFVGSARCAALPIPGGSAHPSREPPPCPTAPPSPQPSPWPPPWRPAPSRWPPPSPERRGPSAPTPPSASHPLGPEPRRPRRPPPCPRSTPRRWHSSPSPPRPAPAARRRPAARAPRRRPRRCPRRAGPIRPHRRPRPPSPVAPATPRPTTRPNPTPTTAPSTTTTTAPRFDCRGSDDGLSEAVKHAREAYCHGGDD